MFAPRPAQKRASTAYILLPTPDKGRERSGGSDNLTSSIIMMIPYLHFTGRGTSELCILGRLVQLLALTSRLPSHALRK